MMRKYNLQLAVKFLAILSLAAGCDMPSQAPTAPTPEAGQPTGNNPAANDDSGDASIDNSGSSEAGDVSAVVAETLAYAEVDERLVYGHFAFPANMVDPLPGVIVVHERWGLDDGVRAQADRLAAQGFVVLAVDLYDGATATDVSSASPLMVQVLENPQLAENNIRQAYQFLIDTGPAPAIGAMGWSFGGGWALNTALLFPDELDATVIYYGQVSDDQERLEPLNVPVLGLFGARDRGVTAETVDGFEAALEALGKDYDIRTFPDAGHGFADPDSATYNAVVAEEAWTLTIDFLNRHLVENAD
jgi:carboxymethylenebutenolidase